MTNCTKNNYMNVVVPQDAVEIKITNIINPYFMRVYEVLNYQKKKNNLSRALQQVFREKHKIGFNTNYVPKIGDGVLVSQSLMNDTKVDLPDWTCRGIITDSTPRSSDVFLLDHGIAINVPTNTILDYSLDYIPIEALTFTVGIHNILPIDSEFRITKEWSKETIDLVKELVQNSRKIYFQVLACDKKANRKYGDFFFDIEDTNICLSKVLIYSQLAVPLSNELLQAIKNSDIKGETVVQYHVELEKTNTDSEPPIESTNKIALVNEQQQIINLKKKQQQNEKILIRSEFSVQPIERIEDSRFNANIHKVLKNRGVRAPKHIQSYLWPAIKQGLNVAVVSTKDSGKTLGYAIPIISYIADNEEVILKRQKDSTVAKPIVLILSSTINECVDIADKCNQLLGLHKNIKTFAAFNGLSDKHLFTRILNKFQILVTTPPFLLRLLKKYPNKLNFSDLSHLILDNVDILLDNFLPELMNLIKNYKIINKDIQLLNEGKLFQIVVAAKTWTEKIHSFVDMFMNENLYVCIGSFVEAAAFCKVQGRMLIRHSDQKKNEVLAVLENHLKSKIMIVCLNSVEAIELNDFLVSQSIQTLLAHEDMKLPKIHEVKEDWSRCVSGMFPVIICTDYILPELEISNIEFLIHYTIPHTSKTQFTRRFSVFMDNWQLELKTKCRVLIFFDETKESAHFKGVVEILKRLKVELPEDWNKMSEGFDIANNLKKKNYPLCDSIKSFGSCKSNPCPYRHRIVAEVDGPTTDISTGDELKLHVLWVQSASHFVARVLERTRKCSTTGKNITETLPFETLKLSLKMKQYYSDLKNRRMVKEVCVGKVYSLRNVQNSFSRVRILNIIDRDIRTQEAKSLRAQSIDDGRIFEKCYVHELYQIPEELLQFKLPILNVFLSGVGPFDEDCKWTELATVFVDNWFKKNINGSSASVYAKVLLNIGDSVWTDSLVVRSKLIGYPDLVSECLKDKIIKHEHGTENKKHFPTLLNLCHSGGLTEINGNHIPLTANENERNDSIEKCD